MSEGEARLYFFDTSALVKRYHQEVGTERVDAAFEDQGAAKMMSDIGVIEFYSVFAKKVRTGEITAGDYQGAVRELVENIRSGVIRLTSFEDDDKKEAATLIGKYGLSRNLRTLDAMHLAVMKKLGSQSITSVYCADRPFSAVIEAEGFSLINPEEPPTTPHGNVQ